MTKNTPSSSPTPFHIFIFILFTLPFHGESQSNTDGEELSILLRLQQHWSNPPSLIHWTSSSDHCTWPEITCSQGGSVTSLNITQYNISGTFPPFICNLHNLTYIIFYNNSIAGNFPTVLYNCSNLQYLDLSSNNFTGTIPDDINRLSPQLEYFNLDDNNFTGSIPASIGTFRNLKSLQLGINQLSGIFPPEIGNLLNLEDLILIKNAFTPQSIPSSFTQLQKLKNLWMAETNLNGEIPESIGNMSALEVVDLSINSLSGNIPDGLFLLQNLTSLFLFKNQLSGPIPRRIETFQLQVIDISYNNLNGTIPDGFGNITSLTGFALFQNHFTGEVPVSMGRLPTLLDFNIWNNSFSGELPPDFGRSSNLRQFQVCLNQFVGELPRGLCENDALEGLIAFDNQLTGDLPKSLGNCSSLKYVQVQDNQLSGEIPDGLWNSIHLTTLMASNNLFTGQLPNEVASNLSLVELMNNQLSGSIPVGVSSWMQLTVLKASNNSFTGVIPQELTALSSLTILLLDNNRLSGNFPSNIISWRSLNTLNLGENHLTGEIPSSIGLLPDIVSLDLSGNDFSGEIPPEIGSLRLSSLNLSSNRLSGRIPGAYENAAFDNSFLNNSGLCSNVPSVGVTSCRVEKRRSNRFSSKFIAACSSIAAVAFIVAFLYTAYVCRKYRKQKEMLYSTWKLTSFQRLSFTESEILSGLTDSNSIGSGGSGKVYRVPINRSGKGDEYVAVKKIWDNVNSDKKVEKEFDAEVEILGTIRHSNTVKLLCCISSGNSKLLVYEYMENRSLDRWLHGRKRRTAVSGSVRHVVLDWPKRLQVAIGAAHGLCYMHHDCSPPIIHRDVKSSNILLDSEFNAKIADFGLARMLVKDGEPNTMSIVAGSFGYMAPEYTQTRRVNEKIDVYSFGVVLLELVTGKEAHYGDETSSLAQWVWSEVQEGKPILDLLDEDVKEAEYLAEVSSVLKLGIICTSRFPSSRPPMKDVLQLLLRCSDRLPTNGKSRRNENDVSPLINKSISRRSDSVDEN